MRMNLCSRNSRKSSRPYLPNLQLEIIWVTPLKTMEFATMPDTLSNDRSDKNFQNSPSEEFAIVAKNLQKTYAATKKSEAKQALKGIDLNIPTGSIFGLLGPNGAGKSTFINIIAGLVNKSSGQASVWGFDIDQNPRQARAAIGVVPQEITTDVFFTPKESLELQAGFFGVPRGQRETMKILRSLGLEDKADAYVRQLSGGMKRRLLVAKAMVHKPPILILDEPTAGVDIELRKQMWELVLELHQQGTTIVLTTHYLEEAQELCDQIAIIHHGEVVTCEPTEKLIASFDNKTLIVTPDKLPEKIPSLHRFEIEKRDDGKLSIPYQPSKGEVADILAQLSQHGISVKDLSTVEADLEDVFLDLTYHAK